LKNTYFYRIFRLRRIIIFGILVAVGLIALSSVIAANRYVESLDRGQLLLWVSIVSSVFMVSQIVKFPKASYEILRIVWATGLAVLAVAIISNFFNSEQNFISALEIFGMTLLLVIISLAIHLFGPDLDDILIRYERSDPFIYTRTIWINRDPITVFGALEMRETADHWNTEYANIEKRQGEDEKHQINLKVIGWDEETGIVGETSDTVPIYVDVVAKEQGISETTYTYTDENQDGQESSTFMVSKKRDGTKVSFTSSTENFKLSHQFKVWLTDYFSDYYYNAKERIEGLDNVSIKAISHQMYLSEWLAFQITKLGGAD